MAEGGQSGGDLDRGLALELSEDAEGLVGELLKIVRLIVYHSPIAWSPSRSLLHSVDRSVTDSWAPLRVPLGSHCRWCTG